ncbi:hypothetical protein OIU76_021373 [Salix suchowensis]|nr:hypothetical protein OIU76_021373 [Salix suchowensis]
MRSSSTEEDEEHSSTADVVIAVSSSKPIRGEETSQAFQYSCMLEMLSQVVINRKAAHRSGEMKMLRTPPDLKEVGNEEATGLQSRARGKSKLPSSSLNLEGRAEEIVEEQMMRYKVLLSRSLHRCPV